MTLKAEPRLVEKLEELRDHVGKKIGPIAKPANIVFTPELPKTRSGKIMRRLLRDVAEQRELGDTTTLADPTVVEEIKERRILRALTVAERPDLMDPAWDATKDQFPEYNNHGDVLNRYWGRLTEERAEFQFHLVEGDEILARARCVPVRWDGTVEDFPPVSTARSRAASTRKGRTSFAPCSSPSRGRSADGAGAATRCVPCSTSRVSTGSRR